jgi:predicted HicB family RNase H-like nuclease
MNTINENQKETENKEEKKYGVVHIDPNVHHDLKVYCASKRKSLYEHASKAIKESLKN